MANHFSAVFALSVQNTRPFVLLQGYQYRGAVQMKAPGGTSEEGETFLETAVREFRHEAGPNVDPRILEEVHVVEKGGGHTKHFFVVPVSEEGLSFFNAQVRTVPLPDGEEVLSPPEWVEAERGILNVVHHGHRDALILAIQAGARKFEPFYWVGREMNIV